MTEPANLLSKEDIKQELMNRYALKDTIAAALADYWEEFNRQMFQEPDEQKLLDDLRRFLISLSEDPDNAEKKVLRKKENRIRSEARENQLSIFGRNEHPKSD